MLGTSAPASYPLDSSPPEWVPQHHEFRPLALTLAYAVGRSMSRVWSAAEQWVVIHWER
jgi:hypothetical protein